jgi:hypothetical protein
LVLLNISAALTPEARYLAKPGGPAGVSRGGEMKGIGGMALNTNNTEYAQKKKEGLSQVT